MARQRAVFDKLTQILRSSSAFCRFSSVTDSGWHRCLATQAGILAATEGKHPGSQSAGNSSTWQLLGISFAALGLGSLAALAEEQSSADRDTASPEKQGFKLLSLPTRQRVFFKYEKRVRDLSTLEKVFDYFATTERDGVKYMLPKDLVRSIVPTYPPAASTIERAGFLDGERAGRTEVASAGDNLFQQFDTDGDGLLSFPEFITMLTLLSIPITDVQTIFDVVDLDSSGTIDVDEFFSVMELLRSKAGVAATGPRAGMRAGRRNMGDLKGVFIQLFGERGDKVLSLHQFMEFLTALHREVIKLEFGHYDVKRESSMLGADFGMSLITSADIKVIDSYLNKVDAMPEALSQARLTFEDFSDVCRLRLNLRKLSVALEFCHQCNRRLPVQEFAKLVHKVVGVQLSQTVLDIIYYLFEDSGDRGALDVPSFLDVMHRRENIAARRVRGASQVVLEPLKRSTLGRYWSCVKDCTKMAGQDYEAAALSPGR